MSSRWDLLPEPLQEYILQLRSKVILRVPTGFEVWGHPAVPALVWHLRYMEKLRKQGRL